MPFVVEYSCNLNRNQMPSGWQKGLVPRIESCPDRIVDRVKDCNWLLGSQIALNGVRGNNGVIIETSLLTRNMSMAVCFALSWKLLM